MQVRQIYSLQYVLWELVLWWTRNQSRVLIYTFPPPKAWGSSRLQPLVTLDRNKQVKPEQLNEHCQTRKMVPEMKDILPTAAFNSFKADFFLSCQIYCRFLFWKWNHEWTLKHVLDKELLIYRTTDRRQVGHEPWKAFLSWQDFLPYTSIYTSRQWKVSIVCKQLWYSFKNYMV